jgi:ferric enterobactin receptor
MGKHCAIFVALFFALMCPVGIGSVANAQSSTQAQTGKVSGIVRDSKGEPLVGATVMVKGTNRGTTTDVEGNFSISANAGSTLVVSYVGQKTREVKLSNEHDVSITLADNATSLDEVVVTALGIKKERKSLSYAVDDLSSTELMKNKSVNAINSLSGKIAGVNITQSSGSAGAGTQIILRGGTSLERDNQPLFVVDGVIYDNSTSVIGNSSFDGTLATSSTNSNRVMDINPEDIENMSVLKGPAAAALYGSRASAGVVIITTKKGGDGKAEINLNAKYITSWAHKLPYAQSSYKRGYPNENGEIQTDKTYSSWGDAYSAGDACYDNIGNFFQHGGIWDTNLSIAGGNKNGSYYLSGSYYDQTGIIPKTGFKKTTFRFNGDQKYSIFTFGANVAYSQARTAKTLTSAALYASQGNGTMTSVYGWPRSEDMRTYLNEDGSKYRLFPSMNLEDDIENPYWMVNKMKMSDNTERFTGNFNVKADLFKWWWISYRMGTDSYTTENQNIIPAGADIKVLWQKGMMSENSMRFRYISTNLMSNWTYGVDDFNFNLLLGTSTDYTKTITNYRMGWAFQVPNFYSFSNCTSTNESFEEILSRKRMVSLYGEFRADWRNAVFFTMTGRNDWTSTLPVENRSYFYPSFGGSVVFTEFLPKDFANGILTFGKIRASWARVGKDAAPYATNTYLNAVATMLGGKTGTGTSWTRGNPVLQPETTESTELGLELRFFQNRLKFDYAYYTNNSFHQILSPRGPQSTGYIFCSLNAGDVYNKGMELSISGTPWQNKDWTWETGLNLSGNRGTVKNLVNGIDILYVTDVQVGNAKAASFNGGQFMAISGSKWARTDDGKVILNKYGMPTSDELTTYEIGNREPKFTGGFNNTLTYKNWSFNMLWEFRVGGDVYNGTDYYMTGRGLSKKTENRESLTVSGVVQNGTDADGKPVYEDKSFTFNAGETYDMNGAKTSGKKIIMDYWNSYYSLESANFMTKVNSLRLRTISLSYALPQTLLNKLKYIKRCVISVTGNNLLLFTNYKGDPETAVAGAGAIGSSSVGMDYCGVPSTASMAFGVNLTF